MVCVDSKKLVFPRVDLSIAELPARAARSSQLGERFTSNPWVSWRFVNSGRGHVPHHGRRSLRLS